MELALSIIAVLASVASLIVSIRKQRKPSLAAAVARGVAYGQQVGKTPQEKLKHAIAAVQREDMGDNGKRDWPDHRIRQEVEALLQTGKK